MSRAKGQPDRPLGVIVGGTRYGDPQTGTVRHSFDLLDLDSALPGSPPERIEVDFLPHGFAVHPNHRSRAVLLEKRGPGGCYVDLVDRAVLGKVAPSPGHQFYGHGTYSATGDALFCVETDLATNAGVISIRDPQDFKVLGSFSTFGASPHDCVLTDGGKTLAITNGGGTLESGESPSVTFVDIASQTLLETVPVDNPRINTGHLALLENSKPRELVVVSAPRDGLPDGALGGVSLRGRGAPLRHALEPRAATQRMVGESLSVCIHEGTRTAVATHPVGGLITFWNLDAMAAFGALDLPNPRGVTLTLDQRYFVVSFGPRASILLLETNPLRIVNDRPVGSAHFGGSHIYTWAHPTTA